MQPSTVSWLMLHKVLFFKETKETIFSSLVCKWDRIIIIAHVVRLFIWRHLRWFFHHCKNFIPSVLRSCFLPNISQRIYEGKERYSGRNATKYLNKKTHRNCLSIEKHTHYRYPVIYYSCCYYTIKLTFILVSSLLVGFLSAQKKNSLVKILFFVLKCFT